MDELVGERGNLRRRTEPAVGGRGIMRGRNIGGESHPGQVIEGVNTEPAVGG